MENFLNIEKDGSVIEFIIDTNIFSKDVVLKAAFNFLDRGYFFFKYNDDKNLVLRLTKREENNESLENIIKDFSDTLLETTLRDNLERENKTIRETIVQKAINGPLDMQNFVSFHADKTQGQQEQNEIDFDKDIDEILAEIENDPDLKIDEDEIEKILAEIEAESEEIKPALSINLDGVNDIKNKFKQDEK